MNRFLIGQSLRENDQLFSSTDDQLIILLKNNIMKKKYETPKKEIRKLSFHNIYRER